MRFKAPRSPYVYEFSYPEGMPGGLAGIVFYVGMGTNLSRMDNHFIEASHGCPCDRCNAIRSVWDAGLVVARRIVFESTDREEVRREEASRIVRHRSPYLTNIPGNEVRQKKATGGRPRKGKKSYEELDVQRGTAGEARETAYPSKEMEEEDRIHEIYQDLIMAQLKRDLGRGHKRAR